MLTISAFKKSLFSFAFILIALSSFSQDGQSDPAFNSSDIGFGNGDLANNQIYSSSLQSDGKIIVAGILTTYNGVNINKVIRLNTDATLDLSFNTGTGPNNTVTATAIQSDGKIVISGAFTTINGASINRIARLNSDGSLDLTFNPGTGAIGVNCITIQSDGKMIIAGNFTSVNGTARNRIARLNSDGSLDLTFNPGTGANSTIYNALVQTDGKIVISGLFSFINGTFQNSLSRLNPDGSLDASFIQGTGITGAVESIHLQSDGKIVIGGSCTYYDSSPISHITRLNADGTLDVTFNSGTTATDYVRKICVQSDQKIIVHGYVSGISNLFDFFVKRLNADGSLDPTFDAGQLANSPALTVLQQTDGKILLTGSFTSINHSGKNYLARLNTDGSIDGTINPGTGVNNSILASVVQNDGKIIIAGLFTGVNGIGKNHIARLNSDGTNDNAFNPTTEADDVVFSVASQTDGKIIIGGDFTYVDGQSSNRIARLNSNGTLDPSFNIGTGASLSVYSICVQNDGKIIIGGDFTSINGVNTNHLIRLNSDGSIDPGFNIGTGVNSNVRCIIQQPDGKIIIGGDFTSINGTTANRIARLNADGTLDNTFNSTVGITNFSVYTISLQEDGKIVIGGDFTEIQGSYRYHIARVNPDGTIDLSFSTTAETSGTVYSTSLQPDGKIIIGGDFTSMNGENVNHIARLNTDGIRDQNFSSAAGANNIVRATNVLEDGNVFIAGDFTSYTNIGRNRIAKLSICYPTTDTVSATQYNTYTLNGQTYTQTGVYTQTLVNAAGCDSILILNLNIINPEVQVFTLPSSPDTCSGSAILSMTGFSPFVFSLDGDNFTENSEHTFTDLCPGVYSATVTDNQSNVFNAIFVIAVDSSYYEEDPFSGGDNIIDSLGVTVENCDIDYNTVIDIYIDSYLEIGQDSLLINWAVVDSLDTTFIETIYYFGGGDGNYYIQLDLFCPEKNTPHFLVATQGIIYTDGTISTVGIAEKNTDSFILYPNPTNDLVTISFGGNNAYYTIYDAQGKLIQTSNISSGGTVSLKDVQTGVYFFELKTENGSVVKQVVKN